MSMAINFASVDYQIEINGFIDEPVNLSELLDDDYQNLTEVVDAIWNDFLVSELELEDALATGYLSY